MSLTDNFDEENDFNDISEANIRKIQEKAEKTGYVDGVTDGKASTFQDSFDKGYADGLRTGLELEKYKSFYEHVGEQLEHGELIEEKKEYVGLQLPIADSQDHFQYVKQNEECQDIESISKKQHIYMDQIMQMFKDKLPVVTNLFCLEKPSSST